MCDFISGSCGVFYFFKTIFCQIQIQILHFFVSDKVSILFYSMVKMVIMIENVTIYSIDGD